MIMVQKAENDQDMRRCLDIRRAVFIDEQNVLESEEIDGLDAESEHYLLMLDSTAVGTARIRYVTGKAKIERVARIRQYRGNGLGKTLMLHLIQAITASGRASMAILGSQVQAIPFYKSLDFTICSDEYIDAGIPHKDMQLEIRPIFN